LIFLHFCFSSNVCLPLSINYSLILVIPTMLSNKECKIFRIVLDCISKSYLFPFTFIPNGHYFVTENTSTVLKVLNFCLTFCHFCQFCFLLSRIGEVLSANDLLMQILHFTFAFAVLDCGITKFNTLLNPVDHINLINGIFLMDSHTGKSLISKKNFFLTYTKPS